MKNKKRILILLGIGIVVIIVLLLTSTRKNEEGSYTGHEDLQTVIIDDTDKLSNDLPVEEFLAIEGKLEEYIEIKINKNIEHAFIDGEPVIDEKQVKFSVVTENPNSKFQVVVDRPVGNYDITFSVPETGFKETFNIYEYGDDLTEEQ